MFIESKERKNAVCAFLTFPKENNFYDEKIAVKNIFKLSF